MKLSLSHWYPGSGVVSIPDLCPLSYFKTEVVSLSNISNEDVKLTVGENVFTLTTWPN